MAAGATSPIPAPLVWLEASLITGKSDGDTVSTWTDASGHGYDATVGSLASPIYKTNIVNGKPIVRFNGTTQGLSWSGDWTSGLTAAELFIVFKLDADPPGAAKQAGHVVQAGGVSGASKLSHLPFTDSTIYESFGTTARKTVGNPAASMSSQFRCYNIRDAASQYDVYLDATGLFSTSGNTVGFGAYGRYVGHANGSTDDRWFDGDAALILIYGSVLSSGDRTLVRAYITSQYAITF